MSENKKIIVNKISIYIIYLLGEYMCILKFFLNFFSAISIIFLLFGGIYFSLRLDWQQLKIISIFKSLIKGSDSTFAVLKNLTVSLAARIGVGSISGVALAINFGGPGSILWIWILGLIASINTYCESYLGVKYQRKTLDSYEGGPAFYIKKAFKKSFMSKMYALIVIFTYIIGFMAIQSNTIVVSLNNSLNINIFLSIVILIIATFFSIIYGLKRIENITSVIIPLIGFLYVFLCFYVVINNYNKISTLFLCIVKSAFNVKAFFSSFLPTFIIGMQRGIFCTESGLGTGSIASSVIKPINSIEYSKSQIFGIYFTVFIICTSTALIILTSDYNNISFNNINGIELMQYSMNYHFGNIGTFFLVIIIIILAYSTIVAGYYYGESNLKFIIKSKLKSQKIIKIVTIIVVGIGGLIKSNILWKIVDFLISILAIINMVSLFKLRNEIVKDYENN